MKSKLYGKFLLSVQDLCGHGFCRQPGQGGRPETEYSKVNLGNKFCIKRVKNGSQERTETESFQVNFDRAKKVEVQREMFKSCFANVYPN